MRAGWWLSVLLAGCIDSSLTLCPGDLACPVGLVCDPVHHGCTTQDAIDACTGLAALSPCVATGVPDGVCHDGVCLPRGCGNGRLDPGEMCDDGNQLSGDGCHADCLSDETCGNGVIDAAEQCDDGNTMSHDGCDSGCNEEVLRWFSLGVRTARGGSRPGTAYDTDRGRLVTFSGLSGSSLTSEWDGNAWADRTPVVTPSPSDDAAMAYDGARHQIVMFGGIDGIQNNAETWIWDGSHWTEVSQASGPPGRYGAAMAYDAARKRIVLFGGGRAMNAGVLLLTDTWEWDGATWVERTPVSPAPSPGVRMHAALAFDPHRNAMVLYGGSDGGGTPWADTWLWDGTTWSNAAASAGPRAHPAMSYSPVLDRLVLTGDGPQVSSWDGASWQPDASNAVAGNVATSFFDPARGTTLLASGVDVWSFDGAVFTPVLSPPPPTLRSTPVLAFDPRRGRVVMYGGNNGSVVDDVWELDTTWRPQPIGPPPSATAAMVYDERRGRMIAYVRTSATTSELWERDGTSWTKVWTETTSPGPSVRVGAALVYDVARGVTVLFGGSDTQDVQDTWLWNGSVWTNATPALSPSRRAFAAMAFDRIRGTVVLFGGVNDDLSPVMIGDTWTWDGVTWTDVTPATAASPAGRKRAGLVFDTRRGTIVLYGGEYQATSLDDAWEWNGARWTRLRPAPGLTPSPGAGAITYDPIRAQLVVVSNGYWALRWDSVQRDELCASALDLDGDGAAGCADLDCWASCAPQCPPATSCDPAAERCGDGTCGPLESCGLCPADCGACPASCGNFLCDPGESLATCPGDCAP